eukprot:241687-Prorocentrum_lima.AAC.1
MANYPTRPHGTEGEYARLPRRQGHPHPSRAHSTAVTYEGNRHSAHTMEDGRWPGDEPHPTPTAAPLIT